MKTLLALGLLFLLSVATAKEGYHLAKGTTLDDEFIVDEFSICRVLTNSSASDYYVPTKILVDWNAFLNFLPSGVTASPCQFYDWKVGVWGSCSGGTGTYSYSAWSSCAGGQTTFSCSDWSSCTKECGGGTQSRTCNCSWIANSGSQTRTANCNIKTGSGIQTRTVHCIDFSGNITDDSLCEGTKPSTTQTGCTPTNQSVCGTADTQRTCTPWGAASCSLPETSRACNTEKCCEPVCTCSHLPTCAFNICSTWSYQQGSKKCMRYYYPGDGRPTVFLYEPAVCKCK